MENKKKDVCPYKAKDTDHNHVFHYGGKKLYCENTECENLDQTSAFFIEDESRPVGICRTDGFVDENSELITKIKGSEFFKTLEEEKSKEAHKERLAEAVKQFGK